MTVRVYKSTDASAPVLDGLAGSLTTLLDAVLVNGYGATAAAGWAIAFTGTNKRIYRPPTGALRGYFRVQDDNPRASPFNIGNEARISASEGASAIDTQVNTYAAANFFHRKSLTGDATTRLWIAVADERTLMFFCQTGDYGLGWASFYVGEIFSLKSTTDSWNGILIGRTVEQVAATPIAIPFDENLPKIPAIITATAVAQGHAMPRTFTEIQQRPALGVMKHGHVGHSVVGLLGLTQYPNPTDGGLHLYPVTVHELAGLFPIMRGRLRGFWHFLHPVGSAVNHGDTWAGTGLLAGKTFLAIKPVPDGLGIFVVETSSTWETN